MHDNRYHILVVDDEKDLCEILCFNLETEGYEVDVAFSAEEALAMNIKTYSLILLDVMMAGMSGFEMAKQLKSSHATSHIPIVFLTAKDTENDILTAFNIGADDYITKPFSIREVTARVKAVLRRTSEKSSASVATKFLSYEGLQLDLDSKTVSIDGHEVAFTKNEYELLRLFLNEKGRVFSRQELIDRAWPNDVLVSDRTVDVNITRLRKKIGPFATHIATRQGYGYYFDAQ